jgi:hypothetical protein
MGSDRHPLLYNFVCVCKAEDPHTRNFMGAKSKQVQVHDFVKEQTLSSA